MKSEHSRRLLELFQEAADLSPAERAALIDRECAGDDTLRTRIERLLRDDRAPSALLDEFDGMAQLDRADPMLGRELGPYRVESRIARGGMGVVYRAVRTDGLFDREVAIKLIGTGVATAHTIRRFEQERRALALLDHENIARLYDGGTTEEGNPYFVMEYVEGVPIDAYCDERRLSISERLQLFATICRAVHFAHQNLVVHRDLKPSNVLVDARGVPKLLDFGIARIVHAEEAEGTAERTQTLMRVLTPEYASPEQLSGGAVTTASDIYSLGVVLYGLLTGRRPIRLGAESPAEWERRITEHAPTRPSTEVLRLPSNDSGDAPSAEDLARRRCTTASRLRRRLRGDLDRIVLMALRKEPERRYSSAVELAEDLERHLQGRPIAAREDSLLYLATRFVRRNRLAVAAGSAVVLALLAGLVAARRGEQRARAEALHARVEARSFEHISDFLMGTFLTSDVLLDENRWRVATDELQRHAERVRVEHAGDPHLRANLLDALGEVCLALGLFDDAQLLVQEALELRRAEFGTRSLEYALSLDSLGTLQLRRGEYETAVESFAAALELHRTSPLGVHTDIATSINDLAVALRNAGRAEEAIALHREALALRREVADGAPPVAESLSNLAVILLERGEYAEARELVTEALAIRRRVFGEADLRTGQTLANLAGALWGLGDKDAAREHLEQAAEVFRGLRALGCNDLGIALGSLATLDLDAGDLDEAERHLREALELQVAGLGPDHPDVATSLRNLAVLQQRRGRTGDARTSWEEVLRIRRSTLSDANPLLGRTLQEYGAFLLGHDLASAEPVLREAVAILGASPHTPEAWLARAEVALGYCRQWTARAEEAALLLRSAALRLERAPGATESERESLREFMLEIGLLETSAGS